MLSRVLSNTEQKAHNPHTGDQTRSAVPDKWKNHPLCRKKSDNHADIEQRWSRYHHGETNGEGEEEGIVPHASGDEETSPHHHQETDQDTKTTDKPKFLRDNREDEIRMRRG